MVKPLSFKGDKKVKKRKHKEDTTTSAIDASHENASTAEADVEETWTIADSPSDLSGPIMILLPGAHVSSSLTSTPAESTPKNLCLASDASGTVFTSVVENFIPDTPVHLSAEPSDVRQVWVVNRIPGENSGWMLKSHAGKYLSADRIGGLSADREAAGAQEVFFFVAAGDANAGGTKAEEEEEDQKDGKVKLDGGFRIRTSRDTYVSVSSSTGRNASSGQFTVRGDSETASDDSIVYIRMQSRFKPRLKATRELKAKEKVSRKQLEEAVGRRLDEDEVRRLKKARREGGWHEAVLDARVKGSHDKFA